MASGLDFPTFYDRFEFLRHRLRRHLGWQTLAILSTAFLLGFFVVTGLDYRFELPWIVRAAGLIAALTLGLVSSIWLLAAGLRRWTSDRTASAIERRFPELGQRIRTTVEYRGHSSDELKSLGVAPGLVRALELEAAVSTLPLPLENLIPVRRLIALIGFAALISAIVASLSFWDTDWRTALRRSLLSDQPFTQFVLGAEDTTVDRGTPLALSLSIRGRTRETVILKTRNIPAGGNGDLNPADSNIASQQRDPEPSASDGWSSQTFALSDAECFSPGEMTYEATFAQVNQPFEFQWIAGPIKSSIHRVDVRFPLEIKSVTVEITPPEYTGLPPAQLRDGNANVLEGSQARFVVELDREPSAARVILTSVAKSKFEEVITEVVTPVIDGTKVQFEKVLSADLNWRLEAESALGLPLAENSYRIQVRQDGPPTVHFEEPSEALDVHSLAEILMRIRARDDFGLTRAGIVFQINNDEEHVLFAEDYVTSPHDVASTDRTPKTSAMLEGVLPLEHFKLIQKDSITYYGFAEDNRPEGTQRTETELRFIDIRPFKILYRLPPPNPGGDAPGDDRPRRATFEELIGRQRTALNRTLSMKRSPRQDLGGLDRLMKFESEIAELTSDLARFLKFQAEMFNFPALLDNADLLLQAERAMLDSVDSLSVGKYDVAMLQEKDAVRFLVESRDRLEVILQDSDTAAALQPALANYFQQQQTKLRRKPKKNQDDIEKAADMLAQLAELASKQALIAAALDSRGDANLSDSVSEESTVTSEQNQGLSPTNSAEPVDADDSVQRNLPTDRDSSQSPPSQTESMAHGRMSLDEISRQQQEIAAQAAAAQQQLGQMREATELAKRRMASATERADAAFGASSRGNSKSAAKAANEASDQFAQLLTLAQGLLAPELSDQLGVARDMAEDIRRQEEQFARSETPSWRTDSLEKPAGTTSRHEVEDRLESMARQAQKRAADGESLADILNSAVKSTAAADQKSIPKIAELLDKGGLATAVERMQQQPNAIRGGKVREERKVSEEIADRLGEAAQQLDALQREILNPKIAELMELETNAEKLAEGIDDVETKRQSEQWLQSANQFLEKLEEAEEGRVGFEEELWNELTDGGWDSEAQRLRGAGDLQKNKGIYRKSLKAIATELRQHVHQLLLNETTASGDETPPAQYENFVSKYHRSLTIGRAAKERPASDVDSR